MTIQSNKLPLDLMDDLAESENYRPDVYRPYRSLHKWWARRAGTTFRILGLATLTDDGVDKDDILRRSDGGNYDGLYLNPPGEEEFEDVTVLDPFSGGGTTHVELNRLGATTIGYELNPVAWWAIKKTIDEVDVEEVKNEAEALMEDVREDLDEYYTTTDPDTGEDGEVLYTFQTQTLPCLTCDEKVELFPRHVLSKAKVTMPGVLYCPNSDCDDRLIVIDEEVRTGSGTRYREIGDEETCPNCNTTFEPMDGNCGYGKYTCPNGHKNDIKETLQRKDRRPSFEYFAIRYRAPTGEDKWKTPDDRDLETFDRVKEELQENIDDLPIPDQELPDGGTRTGTGRLLNYNFARYRELFTDRHLLTYGKLFERAMDVDDQNIREFLVTAISNSLERNSLLCKWDYDNNHGMNVFERKAYIVKNQPVEGNPLNREGNIVALENFFDKVTGAKEYCQHPFEKLKESGSVNKYPVQGESVSEDRLENIKCRTSERMGEDDNSVDYIITDPPYFDNIQYSELSEFFYVWLRECLGDDYEEFNPEHVPSGREIIVNEVIDKDKDFFIESLSNVFSECNRVLKDDGEMVFTYHHTESNAWTAVIAALVNSGFTVTGAYPVLSELPNNPQISDLDNTEYDIIITANMEDVNGETTLQELKQTLYFDVQDWLEEERQAHRNLSVADLGVVLRGRCLYHFSKFHPDIYHEGEQVDVERALQAADEVISQILESIVDIPGSIDVLTRAYVGHLNRAKGGDGSETFDDLRKHLMPHNLNVDDLEDEQLVSGPRTDKTPVTPGDRVVHIENKLQRNGDLLAIDKIHYLYHLFTTDQDVAEYLRRWKEDDLEQLADKMEEITGDDAYSQMMNLTLSNY